MESLTETPVTKFNENTLEDIRKEFNLHHEGVLDEMINNFEDWIYKQNHFLRHSFGEFFFIYLLFCYTN